jgi:hypothetical protein
MATKFERAQARLLLECHKDGYSVWIHIRAMKNAYLASAASGVFCVILFYYSVGQEWMAWVALGGLAGFLLRDMNWFHGCLKAWPLSERIMDWAKVEVIAQEPDAAPGDDNAPQQSR